MEPPSTAYSQPALHDSSTHSGQAFAHSTSLPAFSGMGLTGSSQQQQQQELLERLRGGGVGGLQLPAGMESLVSLAAKQAAKEEELASLRSQVRTAVWRGGGASCPPKGTHSLSSPFFSVLEAEVSDFEKELSLRDCSIDRMMPPVPLTHSSPSDICA